MDLFQERAKVNTREEQFDLTINDLTQKEIDKTGAISRKRQSDIEQKFNAQSLDKRPARGLDGLFKKKWQSNLNKTTFIPRRSQWNRFKKKAEPVEDAERLLCFEMVGQDHIGISFQGFFSPEINDAIKHI
jgi:hypothetical protein